MRQCRTALLTYAVGFVARPIGSIVFGRFGDKYGRKQPLQFSIILVGVSLVDHVKPGTKVYDDEIFGPVLSVVPVGTSSFGGWKDSLLGDTHMYGPDSIRFHTRGRVVTTR